MNSHINQHAKLGAWRAGCGHSAPRPAATVTCRATRRKNRNLPPEDEASWRGEVRRRSKFEVLSLCASSWATHLLGLLSLTFNN